MRRLLTSVLLIPLVTSVIFIAPEWLFFGVVAAVACLCFREYARLAAAHDLAHPGPFGYVAGLLFLFAPRQEFEILLAITLLTLVVRLRTSDLSVVLPSSGALLMGILYVFGAWRACLYLRQDNPHWLFFALALNWVGDSAALAVGRTWGKHKMAPTISPKKTWEGACGSLVAGGLLGGIYVHQFIGTPLPVALFLGAFANMAGQVGDLAESAWKRGVGVKDSGTMLPGHGGWLDRLDSSLFSLSATWLLLQALPR